MNTTTNTKKTVSDFNADLAAAAAKCGVSLDGLTVKWTTLDRTWGDLCGWVFVGENAERAAQFASKWVAKNMASRRNYDQQIQVNQPEACDYAVDNVGNVFTNRSNLWDGDKDGRLDWKPAFKLAVVYYPCAE
jgi:hypothetical protein